MQSLNIIRLYYLPIIIYKVCVDDSVCFIPIFLCKDAYICIWCLHLLHLFGNLLAYVAALFLASVSKLERALSGDARTGDSQSLGRGIESASAKVNIYTSEAKCIIKNIFFQLKSQVKVLISCTFCFFQFHHISA